MKNAKHLCKRGLALLLALIMCVGMLSVSVGALELKGTIAEKSLKQVDEVLEKLEKATPEEDLKEDPQEPSQDANGTDDQSNPPETPETPEDPETPSKSLQDRLQEALDKVVQNRTDENGNLELKTEEDLKPAEEVAQAKAAARSKRSSSNSVSLLSTEAQVPAGCAICEAKDEDCKCCDVDPKKPWDGTICTCWYDAENSKKEYNIYNAAQLAGLAQLVNDGTAFSDVKFTLGDDINLGNKEWTPIGGGANGKSFQGNFDGGQHTISNLRIEAATGDAGLFGRTPKKISNLTVENVYIDCGEKAGCGHDYVAAVVGNGDTFASFENVTVQGSIHLVGKENVGGIVGHTYGKIEKCFVKGTGDSLIASYIGFVGGKAEGKHVGGICGYRGEDEFMSGCGVSGITIYSECGGGAGGIAGTLQHGNHVVDCWVKDVTIQLGPNALKGAAGMIAGANVSEKSELAPSLLVNNDVQEGCSLGGVEATNADQFGGQNRQGTDAYAAIVATGVQYNESTKKITGAGENAKLQIVGKLTEGVSFANHFALGEDATLADFEVVAGDGCVLVEEGEGNDKKVVLKPAVAEVNGKGYATLQDAIDAAQEKDEVKLLDNVEPAAPVTVKQSITLNLGQYNITGPSEDTWQGSGKDGKHTSADAAIRVTGGTLTLTGTTGTITPNFSYGMSVESGAKIEINGGAIAAGDGEYGVYVLGGGELTVNDGKISAGNNGAAITTNGNQTGQKITINGGTLTSGGEENPTGEDITLYLPYVEECIINGGDITAWNTAIELRGGKLTVNGGNITATRTPTDAHEQGSGSTSKGAGIAVSPHKEKQLEVNINGGIIKGYTALYFVDTVSGGSKATVTASISGGAFEGDTAIAVKTGGIFTDDSLKGCVTGGTFTDTTPKEKSSALRFISEDKNDLAGGNGTFTVVPAEGSVATVNGAGYTILQAAIDAVEGEGTVVVLKAELDEQLKITDNRTVTLDLSQVGTLVNKQSISVTKGKLIVTGGTFESKAVVGVWMMAKGEDSASVDVAAGAAIKANYYALGVKENGNAAAEIAGTLEGGYAGLYINGSVPGVADITVKNTAVIRGTDFVDGKTVNDSGGIYAAGKCNITIEADDGAKKAQISGYSYGIEIRAGELTVNGGEIKATTTVGPTATTEGNGSTTVGAGIAVSPHNGRQITVTINGGEITGPAAVYFADVTNNAEDNEEVTASITGGTFNGAVADNGLGIFDDSVEEHPLDGIISGGIFSHKPADEFIAVGAATKSAGGKFAVGEDTDKISDPVTPPTSTGGSRGGSSSTGGGNVEIVEDDVPLTEAPFLFIDIADGDWFYDAVKYVFTAGLMQGVADGEFAPGSTTTRAMLMTILARMDGVDTDGGSSWYEKAMEWAVEQGVSDGSNPEGAITREQLATMLWRYLGQPEASGDAVSAFPDASSVSDWAKDAMIWAVENGIINGSDGKLNPQTGATRAEMATMLMRFCEKYVTLV